MADLLHVMNMPLPEKMRQRNVVPLAIPCPVDPTTAPYLVSGTKEPVVWVPEAPKGKLHAGIRTEDNFRTEVVDAVTLMGMQQEWGNVNEFNLEGVQACIEYLKEFEIEDIDLVVNASSREAAMEFLTDDLKPDEADWVPEDCIVVLPKDRSFVGWIGHVMDGKIVSVIHNPSRTITLARG